MRLNKTFIAIALTSVLSACGSDSKKSEPIPPPPPTTTPTPVETIVNGKAVKGILTNAIVTVFKFNSNSEAQALTDEELSDATIITDGEGNYTFTVLDYDGPIKVELSPSTDSSNPTTMTCDAPAGCGNTAFGDEINLTDTDPNFSLAAISVVDSTASENDQITVNISALTHLASKLIESDSDGISADTVTKQSEIIASQFGIVGNITQLEATVTTSASAVAGEDNGTELRLGLINAGIMSAMFSGEASNTNILSTKLNEIVADLVVNNGVLLVNQDEDNGSFELAISDVLAGAGDAAAAAVELIKADETLTETAEVLNDLAQEEVDLANEQAYQEANVGDDGRTEVVIDVPTDGDAVAKAKTMVEDIRLFSHLFDDEKTEGTGIQTQGDEYITLINDAGTMVEMEADSFTLLAKVSDTLAELSMAYDEGIISEAVASAGIDISTYIDGATGSITFAEETANGGVLFAINITSGTEIVALNASAEFAEDGLSITLNLDGTLESAGAKFTLNQGTFAKINLDSVASRTAFDNDTYQGDITSGELQLDIALMQKATDTVTNPVTFTGMLKTKLLLVNERVVNERWDWDQSSEQTVINYGRTELEATILPETLTLSGAFSSLEGDLISATLTVSINNLTDYEAPEFKYIGKEVSDVVNITISDDLNTVIITQADKISDQQQTTETRVFTSGSQTGEWTATSSVVAANADEHYWGTGIERKIISRVDEQGVVHYTRAYITGDTAESFGAKSVRITPIDHDSNGTTDNYQFQIIDISWDDKNYDGTSFATLMDADGNILTSDGELHPWDTSWEAGEYASIDYFIAANPHQLIANPLTVTNGAELLTQTITTWWGNQRTLTIDELGQVTFFFNEDELASIASGEVTELNPTAYLTQPLIKDAATVEVSADGTVTASIGNHTRVNTFNFTGEGQSFGNFEALKSFSWGDSNYYYEIKEWASTTEVGLDIAEVLYSKSVDEWNWHYQIKITPIDDDEDSITDRFTVSYAQGELFNDNGMLVYEDGSEAVMSYQGEFTSYDDDHWNENFSWGIAYNPLTVSSGLDIFKAELASKSSNGLSAWINDIGQVEVNLTAEDIDTITTNSTTMFDGYNTETANTSILEDESTFLGVNAALTLEAILGDYQVKLQLSGERTAFENGEFDLNMSYRLPGEEMQRSFTVHYNTEEEGRLTANNFEGVVLVLDEPEDDAQGTQVLGKILVGPTAIVAATIEDRDGIIMIIYSDETTESL